MKWQSRASCGRWRPQTSSLLSATASAAPAQGPTKYTHCPCHEPAHHRRADAARGIGRRAGERRLEPGQHREERRVDERRPELRRFVRDHDEDQRDEQEGADDLARDRHPERNLRVRHRCAVAIARADPPPDQQRHRAGDAARDLRDHVAERVAPFDLVLEPEGERDGRVDMRAAHLAAMREGDQRARGAEQRPVQEAPRRGLQRQPCQGRALPPECHHDREPDEDEQEGADELGEVERGVQLVERVRPAMQRVVVARRARGAIRSGAPCGRAYHGGPNPLPPAF